MVFIPFVFLIALKCGLMHDPVAARFGELQAMPSTRFDTSRTVPMHAVWWKEHREVMRFLFNAPRSFVVLIIYLLGFGRIVIKYIVCLI